MGGVGKWVELVKLAPVFCVMTYGDCTGGAAVALLATVEVMGMPCDDA
jgi:hypothetical protein